MMVQNNGRKMRLYLGTLHRRDYIPGKSKFVFREYFGTFFERDFRDMVLRASDIIGYPETHEFELKFRRIESVNSVHAVMSGGGYYFDKGSSIKAFLLKVPINVDSEDKIHDFIISSMALSSADEVRTKDGKLIQDVYDKVRSIRGRESYEMSEDEWVEYMNNNYIL